VTTLRDRYTRESVFVTASTGIAAVNIGGLTLHRCVSVIHRHPLVVVGSPGGGSRTPLGKRYSFSSASRVDMSTLKGCFGPCRRALSAASLASVWATGTSRSFSIACGGTRRRRIAGRWRGC
jgi:hypothetical protein